MAFPRHAPGFQLCWPRGSEAHGSLVLFITGAEEQDMLVRFGGCRRLNWTTVCLQVVAVGPVVCGVEAKLCLCAPQ